MRMLPTGRVVPIFGSSCRGIVSSHTRRCPRTHGCTYVFASKSRHGARAGVFILNPSSHVRKFAKRVGRLLTADARSKVKYCASLQDLKPVCE